MCHYIVIPTSRVSILKIGAGICAVHTADAVVTGEVSCYNSTPLTPQLYGDDRPGVCNVAQPTRDF